MTDVLTKLAYQTLQQGKSSFGLLHKSVSNQLQEWVAPQSRDRTPVSLPPDVLQLMQRRYQALLETDWQEAEAGVYPPELLFDDPWADYLRYYPMVWLDYPQLWQRVAQRQYQTFAPDIETRGYPAYYVQNFHHQTNGYLSDLSANLYDLQVELLFNGSADAMRRRILAPLKQGLTPFADRPNHQIKILDVACGTGRTLNAIRTTLPQTSLHGIDLSPTYLRKANALLSQDAGVLPQLLQGNAEDMPYTRNYFQAVVSVFLFHELPPQVRQTVINECFRVLQPGGIFIICDSIQVSDSIELQPIMESFSTDFHEPYYRSYIEDDLGARMQSAGFVVAEEQVHFASKYLIAHKPMSTPDGAQGGSV